MEQDSFFWIREEGYKIDNAQPILISQNVIEQMIRKCQFKLSTVTIQLSNKLAKTEIELYFNNSECFPISGFPRALFQDDTFHTSKQSSTYISQFLADGRDLAHRQTIAVSSNRWAGRSHNSILRRKKWVPPDPDSLHRKASISSYGKGSHVLGEASQKEISVMTNMLTNGPSPAPAARDAGLPATPLTGAGYLRNALRIFGLRRRPSAIEVNSPSLYSPELAQTEEDTSEDFVIAELEASNSQPVEMPAVPRPVAPGPYELPGFRDSD